MADERGMIIGDRVEARLDRLSEDVSELKGTVSQMDKRIGDLASHMDKRLSNVERLLQWTLGILITGWFTIGGLIMAKMK